MSADDLSSEESIILIESTSTPSVSEPPRKKRKKTKSGFFKKLAARCCNHATKKIIDGEVRQVCNYCEEHFSNINTTNVTVHIKTHHLDKWKTDGTENNKDTTKQGNVKEMFAALPPWHQTIVDKANMRWISNKNVPALLVDCQEFVENT